ncbi:MAG: XRE family transcriptional regulator [Candidatus Hydrogenedentales bacterium]|jgi:HTH-type transcriptional regulator/antitoxin HigA
MIMNERQYRITKAQLAKLERAQDEFDIQEVSKRIGSKVLANAEFEALRSEVEVLASQLSEYEDLKSGAITVLKANNLGELPGLLVRARIARGLTQRDLAAKAGLKEQQIQRYESEEYKSASLSRLTEIAEALNLNISEVAELRPPSEVDSTETQPLVWSRFPIKEMYCRHWFRGFSGSLSEAKANVFSLVEEFINSAGLRPALAMHRKRVRSGSRIDEYALFAWECRVLALAREIPNDAPFSPKVMDECWFSRLAQESSYKDGPLRAKRYLAKSGIKLVIEPHLSHTHLDGAALLHAGQPVVGLTLRHDRLDNFWFVLMHELIHITKHLRKGGVERIFDDIEAETDELESEADLLAGDALIPPEIWETALPRYIRSKETILDLAKQLKIHPAIIAGRIRNEANNFVVFSELLGQGEVRKQFSEVKFGW